MSNGDGDESEAADLKKKKATKKKGAKKIAKKAGKGG